MTHSASPESASASPPQPILPADRVLVAAGNHPEEEVRFALDYGVGVEVQVFSFPHNLNGDCRAAVTRMTSDLSGVTGPIGYHGPFFDTTHYSYDAAIQEVARMRYLQALEFATILGAGYVVLHSQYNPIIKVENYPELYQERSLAFWPSLLKDAERRGVPIYIENMFDDGPEPIASLLDAVASPWLRMCLDVAHTAIWSRTPLTEWIKRCRPHLAHIHLNDCNGEFDDHLGLGQGSLNITGALHQLKATNLPLTYTLETALHSGTSLEYLGVRRG